MSGSSCPMILRWSDGNRLAKLDVNPMVSEAIHHQISDPDYTLKAVS